MMDQQQNNPPGDANQQYLDADGDNYESDQSGDNSFIGGPLWQSSDVLQGITDPANPEPAYPSMGDGRPGEDLTPSNQFRHPPFPDQTRLSRNQLNQIPPTSPSLDLSIDWSLFDEEPWNHLPVTGHPSNPQPEPPRRPVKRPRTYAADGSSNLGPHFGGLLPSDSEYASGRNLETRSVAGLPSQGVKRPRATRSQNTGASSELLSNFLMGHEPNPQMRVDESQCEARETPVRNRRQPKKHTFKCNYCGQDGLRNSDLKKHELRHNKPFKCNVPGCSRKEGFGTSNDLEKHLWAVHRIGDGKLWKCFAKNCSEKNKEWPRHDNFMNHLRRQHKDYDTAELDRLSNEWYEATYGNKRTDRDSFSYSSTSYGRNTALASETGTFVGTANTSFNDTQSTIPMTVNPGEINPAAPKLNWGQQSGTMSVCSNPSAGPPQRLDPAQSASIPALTRTVYETNERYQVDADETTIADDQEPEDISVPEESARSSALIHDFHLEQPLPGPESRIAMGLSKALVNEWKNAQQRKRQGEGGEKQGPSPLRDLLSAAEEGGTELMKALLQETLARLESQNQGGNDSEITVGGSESNEKPQAKGQLTKFMCELCGRVSKTQGELNKHLKRHRRLYGCTVPDCYLTFGSKSDWKRHENTKHFHLQSWRCQEEEPDSSRGASPVEPGASAGESLRDRRACARIFHRHDLFGDHLRRDHDLAEDQIKVSLVRNKIGRNGQFQFWCGFCQSLIRLKNEGLKAWDERFDHIDSCHFRNGQDIGEWLLPEGHWTKGDAKKTEGEKKRNKDGGGMARKGSWPSTTASVSTRGDWHDGLISIAEPEDEREEAILRDRGQCVTCCQCRVNSTYNLVLEEQCTICGHKPCTSCTFSRSTQPF